MTSKELELELNLTQLNSKIIFYNKAYQWVKFGFLKKIVGKHLQNVTILRNSCFKELRELLRKKYPEKFIRSNNNG